MARTRRVKVDSSAHYHVMSSTNNKVFLFEMAGFRKQMVEIMRRAAEFSGVTLDAHSMMSNHFHIVVDVIKPEVPVSEEEVLRRIGILKGEKFAEELGRHWSEFKAQGLADVLEAALNSWRRRMHDISEFVKTFKELVSIAFKRQCKHYGGIWSGRFASTYVQDGKHLRTCVRYVELNAVRAGMVRRIEDYPFCSHYTAHGEGAVTAKGAETLAIGEERLVKRVAQIGAGKIFGDFAFVTEGIVRLGGCFYCGRTVARPVEGGSYSSHGEMIAKRKEIGSSEFLVESAA